jgi:hypothetical protein
MMTARARLLTALLPLLACCGGRADDVQDPGIEGTLVLARADLHAVVGATDAGDIVVVTGDGSVLALDASASYAPTVIGTFGGALRHDLQIEVSGGAVLVWRDRGSDGWELDAWNRARGLGQVATGLAPPTPYNVTTATPDGQRIAFATGGNFIDGVGRELVYQGVALTAADPKPVELARMPAGSELVRIALAGGRAVLTRYSERALAPDASKLGWPESQEPFEVQWYDEAWQPLRRIPHTEAVAIDDTALRVAINGAGGELAIESPQGSPSVAVAVDAGCRFADAFFLPGGEDLLYTCRGAAYRFHVATGARTSLGDGISGAYPLQCGESVCRDWVGGPGASVVAVGGGAPLAGPATGSIVTVHGEIHGNLSPDGRFAVAPAEGGAISLVEVGHLDHRIVLDRETRGFTWLDGARFVFASTAETNKYYEDAASTVSWRDPSMTGARSERIVTRNVYSPFARAEERALYAIAKGTDRAKGLYRFPLP